jgi:hypothetical protein
MDDPFRSEKESTHAELAVLRILVEAFIAKAPADWRLSTATAFAAECEQVKAELLATALKDDQLKAFDRAVELQCVRLEAGCFVPPGVLHRQQP